MGIPSSKPTAQESRLSDQNEKQEVRLEELNKGPLLEEAKRLRGEVARLTNDNCRLGNIAETRQMRLEGQEEIFERQAQEIQELRKKLQEMEHKHHFELMDARDRSRTEGERAAYRDALVLMTTKSKNEL